MDFEYSAEQRMLADTIGRYLADRYDPEDAGGAGWSRDHWRQLAELGVVGALFPETAGGFGGGAFDIAGVFSALGRGLVVEPFLGTLIAGRILTATGRQVADVIAGDRIVLPAFEEPQARYDFGDSVTRAVRAADGWTISGIKSNVHQAEAGDAFLVSAQTEAGAVVSLFLVESANLIVEGHALIDGGRGGHLHLDDAPAVLVGEEALPLIEAAVAAGLVGLCWEAVAIMDALRDQTVDYLSTRRQFGQPIGQFQALKHRMADVALEIEQARSAAINAAAGLDGTRLERERAVSAAKYTIDRVGRLVFEEAIQMHGGIGMTWDLPLTKYGKRLLMIGHQLGDEDHHLDRYIALEGARPSVEE